jgi:hypothetical protein
MSKRMGKLDYIFICIQQTLAATNDPRPVPSNWLEAMESKQFADEFESHQYMGDELFGSRPYCDDEEPLYRVEYLTLKESAIASRMNLSHDEKIEQIKPLREDRRAAAVCREARPYNPAKAEREHQELQARRAAEEAALTPDEREWLRSNGEALDVWLSGMMAPFVDMAEDEEMTPQFRPAMPFVPVDVVERSFDQHITVAGRIHAQGLGIRLD